MVWPLTSPTRVVREAWPPVAIDHRIPVEIHDLGVDRHLCGQAPHGRRDLGHGDQGARPRPDSVVLEEAAEVGRRFETEFGLEKHAIALELPDCPCRVAFGQVHPDESGAGGLS